MSIVLLITFESSKVIVSCAGPNILIYLLFMSLSMQFELMVVIVGRLSFLHWLVFIIINCRLSVLDNWLTLVICDRLVMMWLNFSFVVPVIIASVKVILSSWCMLDPVLVSDRRYAISVLNMMRIQLTFILLLPILVSVLHHSGLKLYIMADCLILDLFRWVHVYIISIKRLILDKAVVFMLEVLPQTLFLNLSR